MAIIEAESDDVRDYFTHFREAVLRLDVDQFLKTVEIHESILMDFEENMVLST